MGKVGSFLKAAVIPPVTPKQAVEKFKWLSPLPGSSKDLLLGSKKEKGIGAGEAYEGEASWEDSKLKMSRGGLVTQGSKKELSRLKGKFRIR